MTSRDMTSLDLIVPDWPAPATVKAAFTLRTGGVSRPPFDTLNIGTHVGDEPAAVAENRARIRRVLNLPAEPTWLEQVHGADVVTLTQSASAEAAPYPRADAAVTRCAGPVCVVQVADCMPVLFAALEGSALGAAHAGWRGLAGGVLEATVRALDVDPAQLIAWMGPAIGPEHFEVGAEVRAAFLSQDPLAATAFAQNARGRWQCDLYALARRRLQAIGISSVSGGGWCTHADAGRYFSFRREGRCGRMAALIWRA